MLTVSSGFAAAIAAPSRMTRARVHLEILDTDAWLDNTKLASSQAIISRLDQLTNRVRQSGGAYATFEPDYWRLDGSFIIPPAPGELPEVEIGWWSDNLCDAQGVFDPPEDITITCGAIYNAAGLTVTFDPAANEYAADFIVTAYDASDNIIHQEIVTGNDRPVYLVNRNIPQFKRVELLITKWARGFRRARVVEVDFGFVEDYGESQLIDLSIINEQDPTSASLPAGELRFKLDNSDRRFNIMNPEGLYYFLQRRQRVNAEIGVDVDGRIEYVPAGTYYLTEWKSDAGALTASFTARDLMDLLAQGRYRRGTLQPVTAYDLIEDILLDAGVVNYTIDEALRGVLLMAAVPIVSHRDALQLVVVASQAAVRIDRHDKPIIERLSDADPVGSIDMDNAYQAPAIKLDKLVTAVSVEVVSYRVRGSAEVYQGTVNVDGSAELWVEYSSPCQGHQVSINGGTLISANHYAYASRLAISGSGSVNISITADEMEQTKSIYTLEDDLRPANEPTQTLQVSNPLINTAAVAADVAAWLLAESKRRLLYEIDWRQNPALEVGDLITVEDEFGANKQARITRQEFNYAGYLQGKTRAKGGGR